MFSSHQPEIWFPFIWNGMQSRTYLLNEVQRRQHIGNVIQSTNFGCFVNIRIIVSSIWVGKAFDRSMELNKRNACTNFSCCSLHVPLQGEALQLRQVRLSQPAQNTSPITVKCEREITWTIQGEFSPLTSMVRKSLTKFWVRSPRDFSFRWSMNTAPKR